MKDDEHLPEDSSFEQRLGFWIEQHKRRFKKKMSNQVPTIGLYYDADVSSIVIRPHATRQSLAMFVQADEHISHIPLPYSLVTTTGSSSDRLSPLERISVPAKHYGPRQAYDVSLNYTATSTHALSS